MSKNVEGLDPRRKSANRVGNGQKSHQSWNTFTIGIKMEHDPGWHTYWSNPGDTGLPTKISYNFSIANGLWDVGPINGQHQKVFNWNFGKLWI